MKKVFLLVGILSLLAAGVISSCKKDEEWKGCSCTVTVSEGGTTLTFGGDDFEYTSSNLQRRGFNSCSEFEKGVDKELRDELDITDTTVSVSVKCSNL